MSDQGIFNHLGRGLPPYLLCRRDSESTIYSDGASKIFALSNSVTSAQNTDYCSDLNDSFGVSSKSIRFTDTDSELISDSLTLNTFGNDSESGTDSASIQTRINESSIPAFNKSSGQSTINSLDLNDEHGHAKDENFTTGLCDLVDYANMASDCPASNNQAINMQDNYNENFDSYTSPENMSSSYAPYETENRAKEYKEECQGLLNF